MPVTLHAAPPSNLSAEEIDRWRSVPVAIAVDLIKAAGQIDPAIRPILLPGQQPRLFGRAVTALCEPPDFGAVLHASDLIGPGDVLVIAALGYRDAAMIGEIVSGHVRRRGGVGVICDGAVRDVATLATWPDFSVFARFVTPRGPSSALKGEVNGRVTFGGCAIDPGDLVVGDDDGLVALSPVLVRERIEQAEAKLALEADWERSLAGGRSARETFGLDEPLG